MPKTQYSKKAALCARCTGSDCHLSNGRTRPALVGLPVGRQRPFPAVASLTELHWRGVWQVDLLACNLDQGQTGLRATALLPVSSAKGLAPELRVKSAKVSHNAVDRSRRFVRVPPLGLCGAGRLRRLARATKDPVIPYFVWQPIGLAPCPSQKQLNEWRAHTPSRQIRFCALMTMHPRYLGEPDLFDFAGLKRHFGRGIWANLLKILWI